jgi:hypothetical protein
MAGKFIVFLWVLIVSVTALRAAGVFDGDAIHSLPPCFIECKGAAPTRSGAVEEAWNLLFSTLYKSSVREITDTFTLVQTRINGNRIDSICNIISTAGNSTLEDGRKLELFVNCPLEKKGGDYRHLLIACIADDECACTISYPDNTAATALSAVIPGSGQIYKKRTARGVTFLSSFIVTVAAGGICYLAGDVMYNKAQQARTPAARQQYTDRRNGYLFGAGGAAAVALCIYGWNIYDAHAIAGVPIFR